MELVITKDNGEIETFNAYRWSSGTGSTMPGPCAPHAWCSATVNWRLSSLV